MDAAKLLVNALIASRPDYYNSIYAGLPQAQLNGLQSAFNAEARLIVGVARSTHITPLLRNRLHWIRTPERLKYKFYVIVLKRYTATALGYISQ